VTVNPRAARFRDLHREGRFVMANPGEAGSAVLLARAGSPALGTTSAGIAFSLGLPDHQRVDRATMLARVRAIAAAVDVPVSADMEAGYGASPAEVATTITLAIDAGAVGGNLEDLSGDPAAPLLDQELATERIRAARAAADRRGQPFTLTARTDCFLVKHPDAFNEAVRRLGRYRAAGADCLFAPGLGDRDTIAALVRAVDGPVNVVMGLVGSTLTVADLAACGVRRISLGGSLARATYGLMRRAAEEILGPGTFGYADGQIGHAELCALFER